MKLDEIINEWEQDSRIDNTELAVESLKTPSLHHKYYKMFSFEGLQLKRLEFEYKALFKLKHQYYTGVLDQETLEERGWGPNPLKILKQDLPVYMDGDSDLQTIQAKMDMQKQKLTMLESIIKTITNRGFLIKNAIDWERFKMGA